MGGGVLIRALGIAAIALCGSGPLMATAAAQEPLPETARPTVHAIRLDAGERIAVDGHLAESVWQRAEPATDFRQQDPDNGAAATERTEVRIVYDSDRLYMGVECLDSAPDRLLGNDMVRDGLLSADDRFMLTLDPYYTHRAGYFFEINPSGAMGDGLLVPAQGSGFGTVENRGWDGIWLARVRRTDRGWTAEIEIPFRTLSFDPGAAAWGANFQRTVRRKNEESLWSGYAHNEGLYHLASGGRIVGLTAVARGRGLEVKPYGLGRVSSVPAGGATSTGATGGLDVSYAVTPLLKTNLTLNTDFAQTEVDDRQVNLTRFPLFFPEKRDFFLEGSASFDFSLEPSSDYSVFFSRRIGLDERGEPQTINYGAKVNGQAGRFNLGFLQVRTAADGAQIGEDFTVFRPKQRFGVQSYVGMIYTRRAAHSIAASDRQTVGADFVLATNHFRGSQNLQFSGFFVKTPNAATPGDDAAFGVRLNYPNDLWNARISYREVQRHHLPAVGFVERTNYRRVNPVVRFGPRPKNHPWIRQVSAEVWSEYLADTSNRMLSRSFRFTVLGLNLQSGDTLQVQISPTRERLDTDFEIRRGIRLPAGAEYQYTRYAVALTAADHRTVSGSGLVELGTFYSGTRRDLSATLNVRPRPGLLAAWTLLVNRVELPEGAFSARILRAIVNTQFSPFVSLANNVQYDSVSRVLGWQIRFRWTLTPGNDIYLVALNNWLETGRRQFDLLERNAVSKIVYTRRF